MPSKSCSICHNTIITNNTIMRDMSIRHHQVIITYNRFAATFCRAGVDRHIFPDYIVLAYVQKNIIVRRMFLILRGASHYRPCIDLTITSNFSLSSDHTMASNTNRTRQTSAKWSWSGGCRRCRRVLHGRSSSSSL